MDNLEKYGFCPFSNQMEKGECGIYAFCDSCDDFFEGYEKGRVDAIEEFANIVLTELEYGVGGSIEDFIREYVKEQSND